MLTLQQPENEFHILGIVLLLKTTGNIVDN